MIRARILVFLMIFFGMMAMFPAQVSAAAAPCSTRSVIGIGSWDQYLQCDSANDNAIVDFSFPADIVLIIMAVFGIVSRLAGLIAVGVIIYAGFKFMLAQGSPDKIAEAKTIIQDALIGLAIAILAATIVNFVAGSIL